MSVVVTMPRNWPHDTRQKVNSTQDELFLPPPPKSAQRPRGRPLQIRTKTTEAANGRQENILLPILTSQPPSSNIRQTPTSERSPSRSNEQFLPPPNFGWSPNDSPQFHAPVTPPSHPDELFLEVNQNNGENSPSYLIFEPVVSSVTDSVPIDWRRYDPPAELLNYQDGIPNEIREILEPSIQNIRARHEEEVQRRAATARRGGPLTRGRKVSGKPVVTMTGALETPEINHKSRMSGGSELSVASNDSGYTSRSPEIGTPSNLKSPAHLKSPSKPLFGFSSRFRIRKHSKEPSHGEHPLSPPIEATPAINVSATEPSQPEPLEKECVSCLDDFPTADLVKLSCHSYCAECFQRLISTALESETHWPVKCCLNTIPFSEIMPHISSTIRKTYRAREAEWSIPAGDRIYCSAPNCATFIPPKTHNLATHSAKCPKCSKKACTICRNALHAGEDCPQDPSLQATIELAELEGWKRCYSCRALVEHNQGCRHMTCRCKAQFCYICGERWRTCACTDQQLEEMQALVAVRRQEAAAQTAQQLAAAQEEAEILAMVADFERREAEREAREAEQRRIREEQERFERERDEEIARRIAEEARIAAVNARFQILEQALEGMHEAQKVLIAERYEFEAELMKKERQDALETLSIRHPQEIQLLGMESQAKLSDEEHKFDTEYRSRLQEERSIEDRYIEELRDYWAGKPEAEYEIREARDKLRRDQDKEYRFWDAHRKTRLRALAEGESRKMEALRVKQRSEVRAVEGRAEIDEVEWKRKIWAEGSDKRVASNQYLQPLMIQPSLFVCLNLCRKFRPAHKREKPLKSLRVLPSELGKCIILKVLLRALEDCCWVTSSVSVVALVAFELSRSSAGFPVCDEENRHFLRGYFDSGNIIDFYINEIPATRYKLVIQTRYWHAVYAVAKNIDLLEIHRSPLNMAAIITVKMSRGSPIPGLPLSGMYLVKESDDPEESTRGRILNPQWIDPDLLGLWKFTYTRLHDNSCKGFPDETLLSIRLIWLIDVTRQCLVPAPEKCSYVALSYVWGDQTTLKTTKSNMSRLQQIGSLSMNHLATLIAKTIRDAIRLVVLLAERYLWVATLCIVQDDESQKRIEMAKMAAIYANVSVTILAKKGEHANSGLRGLRDISEPRDLWQGVHSLKEEVKVVQNTLGPDSVELGVQKPVWESRGWTYQEYLFSRRRLIFDGNFQAFDSPPRWTPVDPTGISFSISSALAGGFVLGLPIAFFDIALLWQPDDKIFRRVARDPKKRNCLPSWSWAGWSGAIEIDCRSASDFIGNSPGNVPSLDQRRITRILSWKHHETTESLGTLIDANILANTKRTPNMNSGIRSCFCGRRVQFLESWRHISRAGPGGPGSFPSEELPKKNGYRPVLSLGDKNKTWPGTLRPYDGLFKSGEAISLPEEAIELIEIVT
ncbi:hypothetical protein G7Y89_g2875 [Cudoniella acicularis]|uniref:RING-type domain-containing protein n=1 Tax=Cudoniella acicularis TaxID=354080 RepID=A0A8H4W644_9HELO|nr:hypothetical protein G7Y89_g2875 [Cudoniella acicularis]